MRVPYPARTIWLRLLVAGLVVVAGLVWSARAPNQSGSASPLVSAEPSAAATFIASQRDKDAVAAARVTSPLYRQEMDRRGRGADWPLNGLWLGAAARLTFTFVGAVSDSSHFTHALYTARTKDPSAVDAPTSLWRIDLDPRGRVIWGELTRVFDSPSVRVVRGESAAPGLGGLFVGPIVPRGKGLRLVLGVRSAAGDGYLALRSDRGEPGLVGFAQQDASGDLAPSYWSYGQTTTVRVVPAHPLSSDLADSAVEEEARLLDAYLGSIGWEPAGLEAYR